MNKKTKEHLELHLKELFKKSNISSFNIINDIDNDINFLVNIKNNFFKDNNKSNIKFQLLIYSDGESLTIYCPYLYKLNSDDSGIFTLNAINEVNNRIALGKIYLNQFNLTTISYIHKVLFTNIFTELTPKLLNDFIDAFLYASLNLYNKMEDIINKRKGIGTDGEKK